MKNRTWLYLFFTLAILNLSAEFTSSKWLIFGTKPLLMVVLSIYFYLETNPLNRFCQYILWGFVFSFFGDTFLMLVENRTGGELYFLLGLGSFLLTHLFYLLAFWSVPKARSEGFLIKNKWLLLPFLLYLVGYTRFLWSDIPSNFQIPVVIYSSMIVAMAMACLNLNGILKSSIFKTLFVGVVLFVISDSIIGLNKFKAHQFQLPYPRLLIMIPYLLSQYLIAKASIALSKQR